VTHLARELGPRGIHVNAIAPGAVLHENLIRGDTGMTPAEIQAGLQSIVSRTHVGRVGEPADIAHAVVLLASAASDYVSGQVLFVDGGASRT
jgi:NAD(P)-dependent dehydrogenase (short-subunit alcohol dehydrogenase family)